MKYKVLSSLAIATALLASCTSTTSLQVMRPADIAMPDNILRFVLADRTRPDDEHKNVNIVEGILTGEGIGMDKEAAKACLENVKNNLLQTPRFTVDITSVTGMKGTGTAKMPPPLPWDTVMKICNARNADALVVLESFDTNNETYVETIPHQNGIPETRTNTRVHVLSCWRIYDPKYKRILDTYEQPSQYVYSLPLNGILDAALLRQRKLEMMRGAGNVAGDLYGHRISPQWIWVNRNYYTKGSDQMKQAAKYVRVNNWDKAAELWRSQTTSAKEKTAGRATFNMALAAERSGDLDAAISWAEKAYTQYGVKPALSYRDQLTYRKQDEERLKQQMKVIDEQQKKDEQKPDGKGN